MAPRPTDTVVQPVFRSDDGNFDKDENEGPAPPSYDMADSAAAQQSSSREMYPQQQQPQMMPGQWQPQQQQQQQPPPPPPGAYGYSPPQQQQQPPPPGAYGYPPQQQQQQAAVNPALHSSNDPNYREGNQHHHQNAQYCDHDHNDGYCSCSGQQQQRRGGPISAAMGGQVRGPISAVFWVAGAPIRYGYKGVQKHRAEKHAHEGESQGGGESSVGHEQGPKK